MRTFCEACSPRRKTAPLEVIRGAEVAQFPEPLAGADGSASPSQNGVISQFDDGPYWAPAEAPAPGLERVMRVS
jgi:hypothetical protein